MKGIYDISYSDEQRALKSKIITAIKNNNSRSLIYDNIIKDYSILYEKYMDSLSINVSSKTSLNKTKEEMKNLSSDELISELSKLKEMLSKTQSAKEESLETLNRNLVRTIELTSKLEKADKECAVLRANNDRLAQKASALEARNKELDQICKNLDKERQELKKANMQLSNDNKTLTEQINKLLAENNLITNKLLNYQEETMKKLNEFNDMERSAKKKKEAADLYFSEKSKDFENKNGVNLSDFTLIQSVEVSVPKSLKLKFRPHRKGITSILFNSFGSSFLTTGIDGFVKNFDASKNMESSIFSGFTSAISEACYDHTEQMVFAGSMDKSAKLWSLKNNKLLTTFTGHIDYINCVGSFYSSLKGLTGGSDRKIKEWDFQTQKLIKDISCNSACYCLGIAFDDSFTLSGHMDGTVRLWSGTQKTEKVIKLHEDKVLHLEILKNENQFLTISKDYSIKLYDIRKMDTVYSITDRTIPQYCESNITVSPDKKYFAIGSTKGTVYVINLKDGSIEDSIDNKTKGSITSLRWRPCHSSLYVGDSLGSLTVWEKKEVA